MEATVVRKIGYDYPVEPPPGGDRMILIPKALLSFQQHIVARLREGYKESNAV